MNITL